MKKEIILIDLNKLEVTEVQIFNDSAANIILDDCLVIQMGLDNILSIPDSDQCYWGEGKGTKEFQDQAFEEMDINEICKAINIEPSIKYLRDNFLCWDY